MKTKNYYAYNVYNNSIYRNIVASQSDISKWRVTLYATNKWVGFDHELLFVASGKGRVK